MPDGKDYFSDRDAVYLRVKAFVDEFIDKPVEARKKDLKELNRLARKNGLPEVNVKALARELRNELRPTAEAALDLAMRTCDALIAGFRGRAVRDGLSVREANMLLEQLIDETTTSSVTTAMRYLFYREQIISERKGANSS